MINLILLSILVLVESIQLLLVLVYINTFFPPVSIFQGQVLPEWLSYFQPERELHLYRAFVIAAIIFQVTALVIFKKKMQDTAWFKQLRFFLAVETIILMLMSYVVFKVLVYGHPLVKNVLWPLLIMSAILSKVYWRQIQQGSVLLIGFIEDKSNARFLTMAFDAGMVILIWLIIHPSSIEGVCARMFIGEQFHHLNGVIFAPAWAHSVGSVLNLDVNSQYGMGMPIALSSIAQWMGAVSYENVMRILVLGCIVYYWLCYAFLRLWLKSAVLAGCGIIIGLKWQMFHPGMYPFIFGIPNGLVVRYFCDIIVMLLIWQHIVKSQPWTLAAAALTAGIALFYVSDTGIYLCLTVGAYLFYLAMADVFLHHRSIWGSIWQNARYFVLMLVTTFVLCWAYLGNFLLSAQFRVNVTEFVQFFLDGYEALPMTKSLVEHQYLQSLMGFIIPGVYALTLCVVVSLIFLRRIRTIHILAAVLSVYGLCLHQYYVVRSATTQYYVVCLPYVFIFCFWVKGALGLMDVRLKRRILTALFFFSVFALMTTHQFLVYPNAFNLSRNPLTDPQIRPRLEGGGNYFHHLFTRIPEGLKLPKNSLGGVDEGLVTEDDFHSDVKLIDYYKRESIFKEDAALIADLVPEKEKAAVLSGMEIQMLMQANRKPFFYYFPLLVERPMRMRNFPSTHLHTYARLERALAQIKNEKPEYIFMEKIFFTNEVSQDFYFWSSDCIALINYVSGHYVPFKQGYYMVAMKRKNES